MSQTIHIQIASDCYLLHLKIRRLAITSVLDVCFAFRDQTDERILRFRHVTFASPITNNKIERSLYASRKAAISLTPEYGLRLVAHVDGFAAGKNMLVDITLLRRTKRGALELYIADGILLIGDEEYLFAPAHSAALVFSSNEKEHQLWISPISYNSIPSVIMLKTNDTIATCSVLSADKPLYTCEIQVSRQSTYGRVTGTEYGLLLQSAASDRFKDLCLVNGNIAAQNGSMLTLNHRWFYKL